MPRSVPTTLLQRTSVWHGRQLRCGFPFLDSCLSELVSQLLIVPYQRSLTNAIHFNSCKSRSQRVLQVFNHDHAALAWLTAFAA